ncbi:MAG: tellurite resistance TerB family protein [Synechococcus sp. ELA057]
MSPSEAFAAIALIAVACDGSLDREEAHALRQELSVRTPYRDLSEVRMGQLFDQLLDQLRRDGWQGLLEAALPVLSSDQQETALAMAAQLVHSDRIVREQELEMLDTMAGSTTLPIERARQIIEVITVLNRDILAS